MRLKNPQEQTDHQIPTRKPDLMFARRKKHVMDFAVPLDHNVKIIESEKIDKYLDHAREKTVEHEGKSDT